MRQYKRWLLTERRLASPDGEPVPVRRVELLPVLRPAGGRPARAAAEASPPALSIAEVRALRGVAAGKPARDRTIILTFLHTGLRRGELAALRTGDVTITARGVLTV